MNAPAQLRTDFERVLATKTAYDANGEPDDSEYIHECARFINLHYEVLSALLAVERKPEPWGFVRQVEDYRGMGPFWEMVCEHSVPPDDAPSWRAIYLAPPQQGWLDPELLGDILEFLQDQYDTRDGEDGRPLPNQAMRLGGELEQALAKRYNRPPAGEKS